MTIQIVAITRFVRAATFVIFTSYSDLVKMLPLVSL